jgi:hypothetical protein
VLRAEAANTNFASLWFDPKRGGTSVQLHSRQAHSNHYTTDAVNKALLTFISSSYVNMVILSGLWFINYSSMTSFFRFANKRAIYQLGIISLAHAPVRVTDFPRRKCTC